MGIKFKPGMDLYVKAKYERDGGDGFFYVTIPYCSNSIRVSDENALDAHEVEESRKQGQTEAWELAVLLADKHRASDEWFEEVFHRSRDEVLNRLPFAEVKEVYDEWKKMTHTPPKVGDVVEVLKRDGKVCLAAVIGLEGDESSKKYTLLFKDGKVGGDGDIVLFKTGNVVDFASFLKQIK